MKHKRRKAIAAIVAAVVLLGGVTAFACVNADKLSGIFGAVLGIEIRQEQADTSAGGCSGGDAEDAGGVCKNAVLLEVHTLQWLLEGSGRNRLYL